MNLHPAIQQSTSPRTDNTSTHPAQTKDKSQEIRTHLGITIRWAGRRQPPAAPPPPEVDLHEVVLISVGGAGC